VQLETYVPKITERSESWGPLDKRFHNDDVLDACVYAYICAETYANKKMEEVDAETYVSKKKTKKKSFILARNPDGTITQKVA
jgi:hypothetical protein